MYNPRRLRYMRGAHTNSKQDFWLSFSDLMSVLVLVFILILFYILYRYFLINTAYNEKYNEMLVLEAALNDKEIQLTSAQTALTDKENELALQAGELDAAQLELTTAQEELARQQLLLNLAKQAMEDSEAELASKQTQLDDALALLATRETALSGLESQLSDQQAMIDDQQRQLDEQQAQLEALVGVRTRIIRNLSTALRDASVSATVDPINGSIMLESDVLFEYGSAELSVEGKRYIDKLLPVYLAVLFADENKDFISEIIIEGHTDTTDTYIKNLRLSQNRAYAVAEYVLDSAYPYLTNSQKIRLKELLTANGRSYSDPIRDAFGQVDADASRRVMFKFRLTDEQMIEQMQQILESTY